MSWAMNMGVTKIVWREYKDKMGWWTWLSTKHNIQTSTFRISVTGTQVRRALRQRKLTCSMRNTTWMLGVAVGFIYGLNKNMTKTDTQENCRWNKFTVFLILVLFVTFYLRFGIFLFAHFNAIQSDLCAVNGVKFIKGWAGWHNAPLFFLSFKAYYQI